MSLRAVATTLLTLVLGCTPGPGVVRLEESTGLVIDRETRAPIAGADVFQVYWGRGIAGEPRPAYALRWTTSDTDGRFAFEGATPREPRAWALETDAAEYGFFHPDYGLVRRGPAPDADAVSLSGGRIDAAMRRAAELELCGSRPADAVLEALQRRRCEPLARPQM